MRVGGKGRARGPGEACAAGCAGQGAVARAAGANCGRRSRVETVAREKRERERGAVGEKGKVTWNQESGIGCSGQIKDFRNLGFRF